MRYLDEEKPLLHTSVLRSQHGRCGLSGFSVFIDWILPVIFDCVHGRVVLLRVSCASVGIVQLSGSPCGASVSVMAYGVGWSGL